MDRYNQDRTSLFKLKRLDLQYLFRKIGELPYNYKINVLMSKFVGRKDRVKMWIRSKK